MIDLLKAYLLLATALCGEAHDCTKTDIIPTPAIPDIVAANNSQLERVGDKITGGNAASIADYPFQLSMRNNGRHICGASIISLLWAVTAAHCCIYTASTTTLRAGSADRTNGGSVHQVSKMTPHEQYNSNTHDYDIALLLVSLTTPFVYRANAVAAIALPSQGVDVAVGTETSVSGWGTTFPVYPYPPTILRAVTVPIVSDRRCQIPYILASITKRMVCAGYLYGIRDSCQGDSGGPMVATIGGVRQLVGVVSWGYSCALPLIPGVYSRVSEMRDWIKKNSGV